MSSGEIKILLIDDYEEELTLTRAMLGKVEHLKYSIDWCDNAEEAVDKILLEEHDVCLVDYKLGGATGLDLIRETLGKRYINMPLILMTGYGNHDIDMEAMKLGASDYLNKEALNKDILERSIRYSIEHKKAEKKLREMSFKDGLTGLANRRYFDEALEREIRRCFREEAPLSLILIDIDFFKFFNDNYGHLEGDKCLQSISNAVGASIKRPGDLVARYGGEELAIILPETGMEDALEIAEEMKRAVQLLKIPHIGTKVTACNDVTISAGVAFMNSRKILTAADLIKSADAALYDAKEKGRNRVVNA